MLRQIFLKSNERAEALKRDRYTCQICGKKQSTKKGQECKVNVHHTQGIDVWDDIIELIYKELLCDASQLQVLCVDCHKREQA